MLNKRLRRRVSAWLRNRKFKRVQKLSQLVAGWTTDHFSPNQITLIGAFFCLPMLYFYAQDALFLGTVFFALSRIMDFVDGSLACHQQGSKPPMSWAQEQKLSLLARINYRGVTNFGASLDPFTDKLCNVLAMYVLGWGVVPTWLLIGITVIAFLLTVKRWLQLGDAKSNRLGKYKMLTEILAIANLILYPQSTILLTITFGTALLLGLGSLAGQMVSDWHTRAKLQSRKKRRARKTARRLLRIDT